MKRLTKAACLLLLLYCFASCKNSSSPNLDYSGWKTYAGSKDGIRYSSNEQINKNNVKQLKIAWTYSTHDKDSNNHSQNQCNPIVVNGVLYGTSPRLKLFALNAATGKQLWIFDPATEDTATKKDPTAYYKVCRGVIYWQGEGGNDKRIFYSAGAKTYAIDATNGEPVRSFGSAGHIDLAKGLDVEAGDNPFVAGTTPGIVYKDLLITGIRVAESADALPGSIRAYDTRTGKRRWIFHTIPHPGDPGYNTWPDKNAWKRIGGANNWSGMALDEARGIVYIPTGSIGGDFYGSFRKGKGLFANSLIALNAATGKYLWHYQVVHHDLWDRDLPANPNLVTVYHNGKKIDAIAQITKHGYVFLLDRQTGKPVFTIKETPVPQEALPGEQPWPTQPIPTLPEPFARQKITVNDVTDIDPETHRDMLAKFKQVKYSAMFTPPSKEGSWIFPGFDGGGEWGGSAVDPESQILYVNSSEMPWVMTMIDVPRANGKDHSITAAGNIVYNKYCISCHGPDMKGNGSSIPSLVDINKKYHEDPLRQIIQNGRNMMPAFKQMPEEEKKAILAFLLNNKRKKQNANSQIARNNNVAKEPQTERAVSPSANQKSILDEIPYVMTGYNRFVDKNGYPGIKPPWGTLNAVNLNSGKLLWKVPLGEYPELTKKGIPVTGTECYGGPLVTKGGLVFIAATKDARIRAFDKKTGKVLWQAQLPVPGYATPSTYAINGRQYVVIACGGGKIGSKSGDEYIAFALP